MKFSHFAFEMLQQVAILVHIRAVFSLAERCIIILLELPQNKTTDKIDKKSNECEGQRRIVTRFW